MEETAGFEPATLRFCKPFLWATQARLHLKEKEKEGVSIIISLFSYCQQFLTPL